MTAVDVVAALLRLGAALLVPPDTGLASRYADTAADEGGTPACWRRCLVKDGRHCLERFPDDLFAALHPIRCAHRTLPCGTLLAVARVDTSTFGLCAVLDHGPHGTATRLQHDRRTPARACGRARPPCVYRGELDMSPEVATRLGLRLDQGPGRVPVAMWPLGVPPPEASTLLRTLAAQLRSDDTRSDHGPPRPRHRPVRPVVRPAARADAPRRT